MMRNDSSSHLDPFALLRTTGKIYDVIHTDAQGVQGEIKKARLVNLDDNGFVVLEKNGKLILIPKDKVHRMDQVVTEE